MFGGWLKRLYVVFLKKQSSMRKSAVKDQLYGGIVEMLDNPKYFYKSKVGKQHEYSNWTDDGKEELLEFVLAHSKKMLLSEEAELDARAKEMTFEALKKSE